MLLSIFSDEDGLLDEEEDYLGLPTDNPDADGDGLPDGYEFYQSGTDPENSNGDDSDNDDYPNASELIAGTNPFNADDAPIIEVTDPSLLLFSIDSVTGRQYQLQYKTSMNAPDWLDCGNLQSGNDSELSLQSTTPTTNKVFYRLKIICSDY